MKILQLIMVTLMLGLTCVCESSDDIHVEQKLRKHSSHRIRLLYIVSKFSSEEAQKIRAMNDAFGDDLVVVWDNRLISQCPFQNVRCVSDIPITRSKEWSIEKRVGRGLEKAMMWAVKHTSEYDYVWTMESDVHFTDISIIKRVIYVQSTSDFLPQNKMYECESNVKPWSHAKYFIDKWVSLGFPRICFHGLQNLFRMSATLVAHLNEIRHRKLGGNWLFNEAMIPTTVRTFNLTESLWKTHCNLHSVSWTMRYRPCHVNITEPGIYHPVKYRNGTFAPCFAE